MRVAFLNQFYAPDISPTAQLTTSLAEHRATQGDEVTVFASYGGYVARSPTSRADSESGGNLRVRRIWTPRFGKGSKLKRVADYACFYFLATWRVLTLRGQDVVVTLTTPPFIACVAVLHKMLHHRTKLVLWNMDCYPEVAERAGVFKPGGMLSRTLRGLNRFIFRRLDHLVVLDTAMAELLLGAYEPKNRKLPYTIIPNWESLELFPRDAQPPRWEVYDGPQLAEKFVIVYLGNTGYGHCFEPVIDAAKQLRDEPVAFLFVGGGSRWDALKAMVAEEQLENVVLHGYVPKEQTPSVMAGADAALITLRDEALGVMSPSKLHSNLAMGLPIVYLGPAGSNVDDAITNYDCGGSFRHDESQDMVEFIRKIYKNRNLHAELQSRARAAFDNAYCDQQTLKQFDRVFEELATP